VIKYIGSKRRLVPVLGELLGLSGAETALDLFTGTTRVAQEFKRRGTLVTAVDTARYSEVFAKCHIETDASDVDKDDLREALQHRDVLRPLPLLPAVQRNARRCDP
jgi:adenine-specific DNA-methyltransferase